MNSLTQGIITLSVFDPNTFNIIWSLSNASGLTVSGLDSAGSCLAFASGSCNPNLTIPANPISVTINGASADILGGFTISGSNFTLPVSGNTFSVTMPVLFSGSFQTCPGSVGIIGGCNQPANNAFSINGMGSVTLDFSFNGAAWQIQNGTYTLNSVPEPASMLLVSSGMLVLLAGRRLRNKLTR